MTSQSRGLQQVENFIAKSLPRRLKRDLQDLRMVREADLEACTFYHLRRYLKPDQTWNVYVRKYSIHTGHYIDLLLFKRSRPCIAIELKWNRSKMSQKDRQSLCSAISKLRVNKVYFITTLIGAKEYKEIRKVAVEKKRMREIVIQLPFKDAQLDNWNNKRKVFMARMQRGKARKKIAA